MTTPEETARAAAWEWFASVAEVTCNTDKYRRHVEEGVQRLAAIITKHCAAGREEAKEENARLQSLIDNIEMTSTDTMADYLKLIKENAELRRQLEG